MNREGYFSWSLLRQLVIKGVPFFSVPLVSNLILWPLLMTVVNSNGIDKLDSLRVAQICAQVIGIISSSLIPVLLVKSSQNPSSGLRLHQKAFQSTWTLSLLIYSAYALSDQILLPLVFGSQIGHQSIQIARILVAAAAVQGLSQIPMQRPLKTAKLARLSLIQIGSLAIAALISVKIFTLPSEALVAYATINLLSPFVTLMCLPIALGEKLLPVEHNTFLQAGISLLLLSTCFLAQSSPLQTCLLIAAIGTIAFTNRELIKEVIPGL